MSTELSIKIDYKKNRTNPSHIFDAMSLYIQAYQDFGQLLSNAVGYKDDFEFQLDDIEFSSIKAKLSLLSSLINDKFLSTVYNSGKELFDELIKVDETSSEEDVESIAAKLEDTLVSQSKNFDVDPNIDRRNLAFTLAKFSKANQLMQKDESVVFMKEGGLQYSTKINTKWRFNGDPSKMFLGLKSSYEFPDKLYVKIPVNEGSQLWTFKSANTHRTFPARIVMKGWVQRYQDGLIPPIGPKDLIEATISYDLYTPYNKSKNPEIRNAKILHIHKIIRNGNDIQYELTS